MILAPLVGIKTALLALFLIPLIIVPVPICSV
jgi:hypothetical protein